MLPYTPTLPGTSLSQDGRVTLGPEDASSFGVDGAQTWTTDQLMDMINTANAGNIQPPPPITTTDPIAPPPPPVQPPPPPPPIDPIIDHLPPPPPPPFLPDAGMRVGPSSRSNFTNRTPSGSGVCVCLLLRASVPQLRRGLVA